MLQHMAVDDLVLPTRVGVDRCTMCVELSTDVLPTRVGVDRSLTGKSRAWLVLPTRVGVDRVSSRRW